MSKQIKTAPEPVQEPAPQEPVYAEVTLARGVEVRGHMYRPGKHVVDQATRAAMGDAVAQSVSVQPPLA